MLDCLKEDDQVLNDQNQSQSQRRPTSLEVQRSPGSLRK
jgi:hypothetical protein